MRRKSPDASELTATELAEAKQHTEPTATAAARAADPDTASDGSAGSAEQSGDADAQADERTDERTSAEAEAHVGKGRPTPKRRESEKRRGPVAPPPRTQREAMRRAKQVSRGRKLTKEERKVLAGERRERMMRGDDAYVLPRDKGAIRAYVRDLVDARRNLAGLLLPIALLSFVTLVIPSPFIAAYGPLVLMVAIVAAVIDSVIFGKKVARMVRRKFPKGDKSGLSTKGSSLGFYAFNRACLIRKWRIPRPRVERGEIID